MTTLHPPIVQQATEAEFQAAIEREFIEGSGIAPEIFSEIAEWASDQDIEFGEGQGQPLHEFRNWAVKQTQAGFGQCSPSEFALLLRNEDGTPWQDKSNFHRWNAQKQRYGKAYTAPKLEEGKFPPAYLPGLRNEALRKHLGIPLDGPFWDAIEANPSIPIVITEGAKKSLAGLTLGYAAIALYGCNAGSKKVDGVSTLIPGLKRFCQEGRTFVVTFDEDDKLETVKRVKAAESNLAWLLRKECDGVTVKMATWKASQGKGLDDLRVNCGPGAVRKAIDEATIPPREALWACLASHNYQLGTAENTSGSINSPEIISLRAKAKWDPNVQFVGASDVKNKDGSVTKCATYKVFTPQTNFDLRVSKILEDANGGGLELEVTWLDRSRVITRTCLIKTSETLIVKDFLAALTRGLKTHLTAKLKAGELADILQNRKTKYSIAGGLTYRLADRVGQQDDGTWVFDGVQFTADGIPTTEAETQIVFNQEICKSENIPSPVIAPQNPEALKNLVQAAAAFYSPEALPYVWLTIGFAVMGLHRKAVMAAVGEMASLAIYGQKGGGKSLAQTIAASLYGLHDWKLSEVSVSQFGELAKSLGSLPIQWDDPIRQGRYAAGDEEKVNSALWKLFTGLGRAVRGNSQAPNTVTSVSSNRTLGAGNAAIISRLISFIFPLHPMKRSAGTALKVAMAGASGGLSQLLSIPYDAEAITQQGTQLLEHLPESDSRNANSLASLAHFTQAFCSLAGVEFDALTFIKTDICPQTNEQGAGKSDLTDFLEKLAILKAENIAGDWNLNEFAADRSGKKYLAVHLGSLWEQFESRFKPNYGEALVSQLAEDAGGAKNQKRYFVGSRDSAIAFQRALNEFHMGLRNDRPTEPKRDRQAKALLIPREVAAAAGFFPTEENSATVDPTSQQLEATAVTTPTPEPEHTQIETPLTLSVGDVAIVTLNTPEGLQAGQQFKALEIQDAGGDNAGKMYVVLGDLGGKPTKNPDGTPCVAWLSSLRPMTEYDRLGVWEVAA
jgi:hypothetical protein